MTWAHRLWKRMNHDDGYKESKACAEELGGRVGGEIHDSNTRCAVAVRRGTEKVVCYPPVGSLPYIFVGLVRSWFVFDFHHLPEGRLRLQKAVVDTRILEGSGGH